MHVYRGILTLSDNMLGTIPYNDKFVVRRCKNLIYPFKQRLNFRRELLNLSVYLPKNKRHAA